jgi:hypothetical protein
MAEVQDTPDSAEIGDRWLTRGPSFRSMPSRRQEAASLLMRVQLSKAWREGLA